MICYNGKFYEAMPAMVSPLFDCCQFGALVFETMRTYNETEIFQLEAHLDRLWASAKILEISFSHERDVISANIKKIVKKNNIYKKELRIKVFLCSDFYAIMAVPLDEIPITFYEKGIEVVDAVFERNFATAKYPNPAYKYFMSRQPKNCFETIFFNEQGFLREGNISNVFTVIDNVLITPKKNVLRGVTRTRVLDTARKLRLSIVEREVVRQELFGASEIFITNTTKEIVSVYKWETWESSNFTIANLLRKNFRKS